VNIWGLDGTLLHKIIAHEHIIYSVSFNAAGTLLATASEDRTVKLWQGKLYGADRELPPVISK
jgi:WD40 repeat protein